MVCGVSTFTEAALCGSDKLVTFQVPNKSVIDHAFHNFINTAYESNGTVTEWDCCIFDRFWY